MTGLDAANVLIADWALLPGGWARDVRLELDAGGSIIAATPNRSHDRATRIVGAVLPGMPNAHSHAFQRCFAGRTEHARAKSDDFWTWREVMYRAAAAMDPESLHDIALYVFSRMLEAGYTSVAEFHYLHRARGGEAYTPEDAMARSVVEAARRAGIGLTLLPVLYDRGGFEDEPLSPPQRRFHMPLDRILASIEAGSANGVLWLRWGLAPHSLRAVVPEGLGETIDALRKIDPDAPIHLHIAEQKAEVDAFRAAYGQSPIAWLLENLPVEPSWCLVHCTHARPEELRAVAQTGAVVAVCPTTEANLGDGLFDLATFVDAGGRFAIGSDSNVAIDPFEELRLLEYGQRLALRRRNILAGHSGSALWLAAAAAGAQALGRKAGLLAAGYSADMVVIRPSAEVERDDPDFWLDSAIFAALEQPVRDVMARGRWVVRDGRHAQSVTIGEQYRKALADLRRRGSIDA
ncbi:MAG TPA: formimidoylglutamate deiminase [Alphaproteobacteria bacterium]|nr:formimidoylglutamate deiminase [Alphaproteobacteria bacterium]